MFKLKPGNVFQKLNKMDRKQAYTWGAIVVVCFIALITLASFLGDAEDASFDGYSTRGYDLAQMPFINDEAEEYLLASKYPDMKNNGSTMLYSQAEKEARQEADAQAAQEEDKSAEGASSEATVSTSSRRYTGRGYTGGRGATGTPTQVGQLGSASMSHAGGSGMSGTYGAPRGDFSPYKSQEKGSEIQTQLKNTDARRALAQFAQTSRAAAGLKDNKNANAKRALMGGSIRGSEAFTDSGVDLSKTAGLELDTNAPISSADLSNLDKQISDASNKAKKDKEDFLNDLKPNFWEQLGQSLLNAGVQIGLNYAMDSLAQARANSVGNSALDMELAKSDAWNGPASSYKDSILSQAGKNGLPGEDVMNSWFAKNPNGSVSDFYNNIRGYDAVTNVGSPAKHSAVQSFARSNVPDAYDSYSSAWEDSYNNNFWATQGSVISQSFSGALNGNGGGTVSAAPVRSTRTRNNSSANRTKSSGAECTAACKDYAAADQAACYKRCMGQ